MGVINNTKKEETTTGRGEDDGSEEQQRRQQNDNNNNYYFSKNQINNFWDNEFQRQESDGEEDHEQQHQQQQQQNRQLNELGKANNGGISKGNLKSADDDDDDDNHGDQNPQRLKLPPPSPPPKRNSKPVYDNDDDDDTDVLIKSVEKDILLKGGGNTQQQQPNEEDVESNEKEEDQGSGLAVVGILKAATAETKTQIGNNDDDDDDDDLDAKLKAYGRRPYPLSSSSASSTALVAPTTCPSDSSPPVAVAAASPAIAPPSLQREEYISSSRTSRPGAIRERGPDYVPSGNPFESCEFSMPFTETTTTTTETLETQRLFSNSDLLTVREGGGGGGGSSGRLGEAEAIATATNDVEGHLLLRQSDNNSSGAIALDAERVVYAKDVQPDSTKRRFSILKGAVAIVTVALIIALTVSLLTREDDNDGAPMEDLIDPRCNVDMVPRSRRTPALQCLCSKSGTNDYDYSSSSSSDNGALFWDVYHHAVHVLQNSSYLSSSQDPTVVDPTSCTPEANSILSLTQLVVVQGESGGGDRATVTTRTTNIHVPYILFMLYNTLDGIHWTNATGWDEPGAPLKTFHGIDFFFLGQVTGIELANNGLKGTIPTEIQHFSSLRTLDLSANPELIGTIPPSIGALTSLNELKLSQTSIGGTIPTFFEHLQRLGILHLRNMNLTGTIPPQVFTSPNKNPTGSTSRLRSLDVSRNSLTGRIPIEIGHSSRLQSLQLQFNQLTGPLPGMDGDGGVGALVELELLNLSINKFSGVIPDGIGRLRYLEFTSFIESGIRGPVPEAFCEGITTTATTTTTNKNTTNNDDDDTSSTSSSTTTTSATARALIGDCEGEAALISNCTCCEKADGSGGSLRLLCKEAFPTGALNRILT